MSTLIDRDPLAHLPATPVVAHDGQPAAVTSFHLGDMLVFAVVTYAGELVRAHAYIEGVPVQMLDANGQPGTTWTALCACPCAGCCANPPSHCHGIQCGR